MHLKSLVRIILLTGMLFGLNFIPAKAQYLVAVKYALYVDGNGNGYMDFTGNDTCVRGGANSPLTYQIGAYGSGYTVNTSILAGSDTTISSYTGWLNCHQFDAAYNPVLVEKTWYTISGCGGPTTNLYIGDYVPDTWYSVTQKVSSTEPNC